MAAVRFWDINMTDVTSCENALYNVALFVFDFSSDDCNTSEKLKQWLCNFVHLFIFFGGGGVGGIDKVHYGLCENGEYSKDTLPFRF